MRPAKVIVLLFPNSEDAANVEVSLAATFKKYVPAVVELEETTSKLRDPADAPAVVDRLSPPVFVKVVPFSSVIFTL